MPSPRSSLWISLHISSAVDTEATSKLDDVDTAVLEHLVCTGYEYVMTVLDVSKPDGGGDD